jgi:hypothetical protein
MLQKNGSDFFRLFSSVFDEKIKCALYGIIWCYLVSYNKMLTTNQLTILQINQAYIQNQH